MSTFHSGDKLRRQTFFTFLFPSSKHQLVFKVAFDSRSDFLQQQPHASNDLICPLFVWAASFMCRSVCKSTQQGAGRHMPATCASCRSIFFFFCLFSDHSFPTGFTFYVITSPVKTPTGVPQIFAFHRAEKLFSCWSTHTLTVNLAQHSLEAGPHVSHSLLAHSSKCSLYVLHHCDKYPAYLQGSPTWGVRGESERNRQSCTHNNGA